ncbi:membrane-spanning 4-domains subfamily A member 15 [Anguilla rostrata]|uniref:membrane-spanning 4-domains subfamily A member 15 n=1 Tax=Anguilla rostrata TaxID=7938 RepID=UPI0030D5A62D
MHDPGSPADMANTFKSDDHMVITIPLSSINKGQEGKLLPENFHCVFKDVYKVFLKGNPKALGTAQLIAGLLIISLGLLVPDTFLYTLPSVLFIISGLLSYAAGHSPNMSLTKLSFSLNIISLFWATAALVICLYKLTSQRWSETENGIQGTTAVLIALELVVALILIYWESKAVCRDHYNILPVINLKHEA